MYGHYRLTIDLEESIAEISMVLSAIKGDNFNYEMTRAACAHYKQLALVCACAFMMSPVSMNLKNPRKHQQVKSAMAQSVDSVYPVFATENPRWGYQETVAVVSELALNFVQVILFFMPNLKYALGIPHMYVFTPINLGQRDDPDESKFIGMRRNDCYRELKALDDLNQKAPVNIEADNKISFTLWVRPPPSARLLE